MAPKDYNNSHNLSVYSIQMQEVASFTNTFVTALTIKINTKNIYKKQRCIEGTMEIAYRFLYNKIIVNKKKDTAHSLYLYLYVRLLVQC